MSIYNFHVSGTHCASCKILIEDILSEQGFIKKSKVDLKGETVEIETDSEMNASEIASVLTEKIQAHGYDLSTEKIVAKKEDDGVIWKAIPIGLVFLMLFFLLQKSGILNFGFGSKVTPTTSLLIGIVASLSSCLAIVGGLVLSLSAKVSQDDEVDGKGDYRGDRRNIFLFHTGRLVSFTMFGGILGALGRAVGINFTFTAVLGIIASLVMLMLGLNLTGVFAKNSITMPTGIFNFFRKIEHKTLTPLLIGFGTFFLPCGFTQAMQIAALSSGSLIGGMLIMFAFAIGTLPMLALLSFGSASFAHSKYAPLFFKSAGVVVIGFGIFALLSGLAGLGIINPLFNF